MFKICILLGKILVVEGGCRGLEISFLFYKVCNLFGEMRNIVEYFNYKL